MINSLLQSCTIQSSELPYSKLSPSSCFRLKESTVSLLAVESSTFELLSNYLSLDPSFDEGSLMYSSFIIKFPLSINLNLIYYIFTEGLYPVRFTDWK